MSEAILVDTDVISLLFKGDGRANHYRKVIEARNLAVCFASIAELYQWALGRMWGERKIAQLQTFLRNYAVIPFDNEMAWAWARVRQVCRRVGRPMSENDAWIAAAAIRHDLVLLSANVNDFQAAADHAGLRLFLQ